MGYNMFVSWSPRFKKVIFSGSSYHRLKWFPQEQLPAVALESDEILCNSVSRWQWKEWQEWNAQMWFSMDIIRGAREMWWCSQLAIVRWFQKGGVWNGLKTPWQFGEHPAIQVQLNMWFPCPGSWMLHCALGLKCCDLAVKQLSHQKNIYFHNIWKLMRGKLLSIFLGCHLLRCSVGTLNVD